MSTANTPAATADGDQSTLPSGAPNGNTADSGSSDDYVTPDVRAAMEFDPFTPQDDESAPTSTTTTDGNPSAEGGAQSPQPASVTQVPVQGGSAPQGQPAPAQQSVVSPEIQAILDQNRELLNAVTRGNQPQQGQPSEPQPQSVWESVPEYNFQVPDGLLTSLNSEDPEERRTALSNTMRGVAIGVHQTIMRTLQPEINRLVQSLPQAIEHFHKQATTRTTVETDFYGKYPQLNVPELKPLIKMAAEQTMKAKNSANWTPELRDEIAQTVMNTIARVSGQTQQPVAQPAQPAMFGGNNGVGTPRQQPVRPPTQQDQINDLFT